MKTRTAHLAPGIALITTLIVVALLSMLAVAFMTVNRGNIRLLENVQDRDAANRAALSGYEYARMRLEECETWGSFDSPTGVFLFPPVSGPINLQGFRTTENAAFHDPEDGRIKGLVTGEADIPGGEVQRFEIRFVGFSDRNILGSYNNALNETRLVRGLDDGDNPVTWDIKDVPAFGAHLFVRGFSRTVTSTLEVVLRRVPYVDSSAVAAQTMSISVEENGRWYLNSLDPLHNRVRAYGSVFAPDIDMGDLDPAASQVTFLPEVQTRSSASARRGTIFVGGAISFGSRSPWDVRSTSKQVQEDIEKAETALRGYIETQRGLGSDINEVKPKDIQYDGPVYELPGGNYVFTDRQTIRTPGGAEVKTLRVRRVSGEGPLTADLPIDSCELRVPVNLVVRGSFSLGKDSSKRGRPKLAMGIGADGKLVRRLPVLKVLGGNLNVDGGLKGGGSLVVNGDADDDGFYEAKGDVSFEGKSQLSADPDKGVTVYASGGLSLKDGRNIDSDPSVGENMDFFVYREAFRLHNQLPLNPSPAYYQKDRVIDGINTGTMDWKEGYTGGWSTARKDYYITHNTTENTFSANAQENDLADRIVGKIEWDGEARAYKVTMMRDDDGNCVPERAWSGESDFGTSSTSFHVKMPHRGRHPFSGTYPTGDGTGPYPETITLERYERLRAYMKDKDTKWLDLLEKKGKVRERIQRRIGKFWDEREDMGKEMEKGLGNKTFVRGRLLMSEYMTGVPNPAFHGLSGAKAEKYRLLFNTCYPVLNRAATADPTDMEFNGFIFSRGDFQANTKGGDFFVRGSLVSKNNLGISDAKDVRFLYDPDYLRNVKVGGMSRFEQLFWSLR